MTMTALFTPLKHVTNIITMQRLVKGCKVLVWQATNWSITFHNIYRKQITAQFTVKLTALKAESGKVAGAYKFSHLGIQNIYSKFLRIK